MLQGLYFGLLRVLGAEESVVGREGSAWGGELGHRFTLARVHARVHTPAPAAGPGAGRSESLQQRQAAWHQGWAILSFFSTPLPRPCPCPIQSPPSCSDLSNT